MLQESFGQTSTGNVGIGTRMPDNSAVLDVVSSQKGVLIPRVHILDSTVSNPIQNPAEGLLIYNIGYEPNDKMLGNGMYHWTNARGGRWVKFITTENTNGSASWNIRQVIYTATTGQDVFNTPVNVSDVNKILLYRNGVCIGFQLQGMNAIKAEVTCDAGDEIKIVQYL